MPHDITTPGRSRTRIRQCWSAMRSRCSRPTDKDFADYGGRGIRYDPSWQSFDAFHGWAISNGYSDELTIERKDVNGNYEPDNCCWIPMSRQSRNRRWAVYLEAFGDRKTVVEWTEDPRCVATQGAIRRRLTHGWSHEAAITTPTKQRKEPILSEAMGESRTIPEWARHESCKADANAIRHRLAKGWAIEDAISAPVKNRIYKTIVTAFGETKTVSEWLSDPRCKAPAQAIRRRIKMRWNPEKAITAPSRPMKIRAR